MQDNVCIEINEEQDSDEMCDILDFAFTQKSTMIQPMTSTQRIVLSQKSHSSLINPNWILLNSQSTINIFNNPKLFPKIRDCKDHKVIKL